MHQLLRFSRQIMLSDPEYKTQISWVTRELILTNCSHYSTVISATAGIMHSALTTLAKWISLPLVTNTFFIPYLRDASHYQTAVPNKNRIFISDESCELRQWLSTSEKPSCWWSRSPCCPHLPSPLVLLLSATQSDKQKREWKTASFCTGIEQSWLNLL